MAEKKTPIMDPRVSFSRVFWQARRLGHEEFVWRGARYTTKLREEAEKLITPTSYIVGWKD